MLAKLRDTDGVIQLVQQGHLLDVGGLPYIITKPFGTHLSITDTAELIVSVISQAASTIHSLAARNPPIFHRDISLGNLVYSGDLQVTYLLDFGASIEGLHPGVGQITGTSTFIARSVLEGKGHSLSTELESLMYVTAFLAVQGHAHWGNKPVAPMALAFKTATFLDQENFDHFVVQRSRHELKELVNRLRDLFWKPTYQRDVTTEQFQQALQPHSSA